MSVVSSQSPRVLEATVRNRVAVGYAVAPSRVASCLPSDLVPDTHKGQAYVALVGEQLVRPRVLGLPIPGVRRMALVELQVPVREATASSERRGMLTVQAFVPRRLAAWGGRVLYSEPVKRAPMQPGRQERVETVEMTYRFDWAGREQRLRVVGQKPPVMPVPEAPVSFLMSRSWRYGTSRAGELLRTRSKRPVTPVYRVEEHHVTVQWASVYGEEWAFLNDRVPATVLFTPGGPIAFGWRKRVGE